MSNEVPLQLLAVSCEAGTCHPILAAVSESGLSIHYQIADTSSLLEQELAREHWDAILLVVGETAEYMREVAPLVAGHVSSLVIVRTALQAVTEEAARECGASDLVDAKDSARLAFILQREAEGARLRRKVQRLERRLEQVESGAALRDVEESFRNVVEKSPFGIYIVDQEFRLQLVSAGAQKVFANVAPLLDRDFSEVIRIIWQEPLATEVIERFRHTLATGEPYQSRVSQEMRNDTRTAEYYDWKIERIKLPDGNHGVVCHFYDLSERYRWERALRASEEKLSSVVQRLPVGIAIVEDGLIRSMNPAALQMHCLDDEAQMRPEIEQYQQDYELRAPDGRKLPFEEWPLVKAMGGEIVKDYEVYLRYLPKGEARYIAYTCLGLEERRGEGRFMMVMQDLTQRRASEKALEESRESLRLLSNPVLQVSSGILLLPLIGAIDEKRGQQLENELLGQIREYRAQVVVIDVTGAINVDKSAISCLVRTIKAAKLLGSQTVLTGISPTLAERFVQLRISLEFVYTTGSLDSGLEKAHQLVKTGARQRERLIRDN